MLHILGTATLAAALFVSTAALSAQQASPPAGVSGASASQAAMRTPTPTELRQIYADRTWTWSDGGGGYFAPNGAFYAVGGNDAKSAVMARGSWSAGSQGDVCFKALWRGQSGNVDKQSCFFHKWEKGKLMQKKEAGGKWYVLKSASPKKSDEYNKLVAGNGLGEKMKDTHAKYLPGIPTPL